MSDISSAGGGSHDLPCRRILVVDDMRVAAHALARLLETLGQEVSIAHDANLALQMLETALPDVVISDIGMPDMDGYELAQRIRNSRQFDAVILVALTGYGQEEDRRRARAVGFRDYLTKPVSLVALQSLLQSLHVRSDDPDSAPAQPGV